MTIYIVNMRGWISGAIRSKVGPSGGLKRNLVSAELLIVNFVLFYFSAGVHSLFRYSLSPLRMVDCCAS